MNATKTKAVAAKPKATNTLWDVTDGQAQEPSVEQVLQYAKQYRRQASSRFAAWVWQQVTSRRETRRPVSTITVATRECRA